jgi:hypothetical protein
MANRLNITKLLQRAIEIPQAKGLGEGKVAPACRYR